MDFFICQHLLRNLTDFQQIMAIACSAYIATLITYQNFNQIKAKIKSTQTQSQLLSYILETSFCRLQKLPQLMIDQPTEQLKNRQQAAFICLNKNCYYDKNRIFGQFHQHYFAQECKKWFWEFQFQKKRVYQEKNNKQPIDLDFFRYPSSNIRVMCDNSNNILQRISQFFKQKTKELCHLISIVQTNVQESIKLNINICQKIKNELDQIEQLWLIQNSQDLYIKIQELVDSQIPTIHQLRDMRILDLKVINSRVQQIKKQIQYLSYDIVGESQSHFTGLSIKEFDKMRNYLEQGGQVGKQLQAITKLTRSTPNEFLISQPIRTQAKYVCPIKNCKKSAQISLQSIKSSRKHACKKLIQHLLIEHTQEIMYEYSHKISKSAKIAYSIAQLLDKIKYQNYEVVQLIDRACRFHVSEIYQFRTLTIQLVYKFKTAQSNNPYIITTQSQIQLLIPILLFYSTIINKKKIKLTTQKKKFLELCQFLNSIGGNCSYKDPTEKQKKQINDAQTIYDESIDELRKTEDTTITHKNNNQQKWINQFLN